MQNNPNKTLILSILNFLLNSFRNSQLFQLVSFVLFNLCILGILVIGYLLSSDQAFATKLISDITTFFIDIGAVKINSNMQIDSLTLVRYFFLFLAALGILQEIVMSALEKVFKKDLRQKSDITHKSWLFVVMASGCLVVEIIISVLAMQPLFVAIEVGLFIILMILYFWYIFVSFAVDKIKLLFN